MLLLPRESFAFVETGPSKEFKVPLVSSSPVLCGVKAASHSSMDAVIIISRDADAPAQGGCSFMLLV